MRVWVFLSNIRPRMHLVDSALLSVETWVNQWRGHWSSHLSGCFRSVHKWGPTRSDSSVLAVHRPKLVTETDLCTSSLRTPSFGLAFITAPVLTFLFTVGDAAITMNSVKTEIMQKWVLQIVMFAVRSAIATSAELVNLTLYFNPHLTSYFSAHLCLVYLMFQLSGCVLCCSAWFRSNSIMGRIHLELWWWNNRCLRSQIFICFMAEENNKKWAAYLL